MHMEEGMENKEFVIVVDFGGQYNQLIARRVRENHVYCEVYPYNKALDKIKVLKRISYGLRHFGRFRVRILLLSKKNGTNHKYDWCQRRLVG